MKPDPSEPDHAHWLLYLVGGACFGWGQWALTRALLEGDATFTARMAMALGTVAVVGGILLHARPKHNGPTELDRRLSMRRLAIALAVWLVPLLIAWVQFEAHRDPIAMFPISSVIGATIAVAIQTRLLTPSNRLARVLPPALAVTVGLSLGIQSNGHAIRHFTYHLSTVAIYTTEVDPDEVQAPTLVGPQRPDAPRRRHDNEYGAIGTIGQALESAEEVVAHQRPDGTWVTLDEDGQEVPIEVASGDELLEAMRAEMDAAAQRDADENLERRKAWEAELDLRRSAGRLFN